MTSDGSPLATDVRAEEAATETSRLAPFLFVFTACLAWGNYLYSGGRAVREEDEDSPPAVR